MPNQRKRHISRYGNNNRTLCGRAMAETDTPFVDTVSSVDDLRAQIISANTGKEISLAIVGSVESDNLCSNCATRFEDEVQLYQGYLERNELLETSLTIEPNGQVGFKMWGEVVAIADEPIDLLDAVDNALATGEISEGAHKTHIQSILDEQDRRQRWQDEKAQAAEQKAQAAEQKKRRDTKFGCALLIGIAILIPLTIIFWEYIVYAIVAIVGLVVLGGYAYHRAKYSRRRHLF